MIGKPEEVSRLTYRMPHMVQVPAGSVLLRDARRKTERKVSLISFEIGRFPVTWAEYPLIHAGRDAILDADRPVDSVSWIEAVTCCNALSAHVGYNLAYDIVGDTVVWDVSADGYRLPTEAEWELACRAGSERPRYGPLEHVAWSSADEVDGTQPVGLKMPNAFGAYDMLGNVWEWCWDYLDPARYGNYRVMRGGGWSDPHWSVRAGVRRGSMPGTRLDDLGFRVARGAVGLAGEKSVQGWSQESDQVHELQSALLPIGWTPLSRD